jgi:hypothetical protein
MAGLMLAEQFGCGKVKVDSDCDPVTEVVIGFIDSVTLIQ